MNGVRDEAHEREFCGWAPKAELVCRSKGVDEKLDVDGRTGLVARQL